MARVKLIGPQANAVFGRQIGDERAVHPDLRSYFSKAWYLDIPVHDAPLELVIIPDGCAELIWLNESFLVIAPNYRALPLSFDAGTSVYGFRFSLGVAPAWLGVRSIDPDGGVLPLNDLNPALNSRLHVALGTLRKSHAGLDRLEAALIEVSKERPSVGWYATPIAQMLGSASFAPGQLLSGLQALTNFSERTVRRQTERFMGFGPKRLERIARFQRFLVLKWNQECDDLIELAVAAGYADQSHLTRETRALTGLTPKQLTWLCYEQPSVKRKNRHDPGLIIL